jgi:hypothetical protein
MLYTAASAIMTASVPAICTAMGGVLTGVVGTAGGLQESHKSRREVTISLTA